MDTAAGVTAGSPSRSDTALDMGRRDGWLDVADPTDTAGEDASSEHDAVTRLLGARLSLDSALPSLG